jgi:hypothetical protein
VVRPSLVVVDEPGVEIGLQLIDRVIDLLAKRNPVKLVQDSAMEALADSVIRHDDLGGLAVPPLPAGRGLW